MPKHVVVDGSNIATEGRTLPSLRQLNDAVLAYIQEHPEDLVTVVVDATFGHRIDPSEVPEFDAAIENNELVSPPAGAIGRGDAFVLTIANKAGATILSNDSFQEFHGDYPWLFDEGRLIGGKPVPHVGWVFVPRAPVRGPISRRAVRDKTTAVSSRSHGRPSRMASEPLPLPKTPPPAPVKGRRRKAAEPEPARPPAAAAAAPAKSAHAPTGAKHSAINELLPFLSFVESHPIGSTVEATTESYSSHGAYVDVDGVRAYVPLRFLGDPAPRSAREVLAMGSSAPFVVVSFNAPRRGIDLAAPGFQPRELVVAEPPKKVSRGRKKAAVVIAPEPAAPVVTKKAATKRSTKKAAAAAEPVAPAAPVSPPQPAPAPAPAKSAAKRPPTKAPKRASKKAVATIVGPRAEAAVAAPAPVKRARKKAAAAVTDRAPVTELEPAPAKKKAARSPRPKKAAPTAAAS